MSVYIFSQGFIPNISDCGRDDSTNKFIYVIAFIFFLLTILFNIYQTLKYLELNKIVKTLGDKPCVKKCINIDDINKLHGYVALLIKLEEWNNSGYNFFGYEPAKHFEEERKRQFCQIVQTIIFRYDTYFSKIMDKCYEENHMIGDCKFYLEFLQNRLRNLSMFLNNSKNKRLDINWPYLQIIQEGYTSFCGNPKDSYEKIMPEIYYWYLLWQQKDLLNKELNILEIIYKY